MIDGRTKDNFKRLVEQFTERNSNEIITLDNLVECLHEYASFSTDMHDLIECAKDFMNDNFKTKKSMPGYFLKKDNHLVTFKDLLEVVEKE